MATTIKLKNSVTTTNAPSSLVQGEVAINITDKKVWVGNAATTPIQLLGDGGSASFTSIAFGAGTVSLPSITFTGDTNTGIYSPAADTIAFTEGGAEAMRIDSSGNVGIGTTSPSGKFEIFDATSANVFIQGNSSTNLIPARYSTDASSSGIAFRKYRGTLASPTAVASGDNLGTITFQGFGGTNIRSLSQIIGTVDTYTSDTNISSYLTFATSASGAATPTERMRIDSSGNVGIGTSSPSNLLQVAKSQTSDTAITVSNDGTSTSTTTMSFVLAESTTPQGWFRRYRDGSGLTEVGYTDILAFSGNVTGTKAERMRIDSSGLVGIGTSSPSSFNAAADNLVVGTTSGNNGITIAGGTTGFSSIYLADGTTGNDAYRGYIEYRHADDAMAFGTSGSERMRITSGGNVAIGNTSSGYKLLVQDANDRTEGTAQFAIVGNGYTAFHWLDATAYYIGQNSNSRELRMYSGSTPTTGVKLTSGATSWASTSDEREKDIIEPITDATNKLSELRTVIGKYKTDEDGTRRSFLIAQDVEKVFPEAVSKDLEGTLSLRYTDLIPVLVKAIQEQQAMIEELKQEVAKLKGV